MTLPAIFKVLETLTGNCDGVDIPYSKKLTRNDFNAILINAEEINKVKELLYFFNENNAYSISGFQTTYGINANLRQVCKFSKGRNTRILVNNTTIVFFLTQTIVFFNLTKSSQ